MDMKLELGQNSDYGRIMTDSAVYYSKLGTTDGMKNMFRIQAMRNVEIRVFVNSPFIKSVFNHGSNGRYTVMHTPGTAFACRMITAQSNDEEPHVITELYFGNWAGADMNARDYVNYPFAHKTESPYIETLKVQIIGPAQAADVIIQKIDWNKLNAALVK